MFKQYRFSTVQRRRFLSFSPSAVSITFARFVFCIDQHQGLIHHCVTMIIRTTGTESHRKKGIEENNKGIGDGVDEGGSGERCTKRRERRQSEETCRNNNAHGRAFYDKYLVVTNMSIVHVHASYRMSTKICVGDFPATTCI